MIFVWTYLKVDQLGEESVESAHLKGNGACVQRGGGFSLKTTF
jgi:hypothetical protein